MWGMTRASGATPAGEPALQDHRGVLMIDAHRVCRAFAAALAGGLLGLAASGPVAALADSGGLFPTPPPAGATPCPIGLAGLLCSTPKPTAAPPPAATQAPAAVHPAAPPAAAPARPAPAAAAPVRGAQNAAPGVSRAYLANVAATFQNAPFLQPLLDILANPTAAQQPDLAHFRFPAAAATGPAGLPLTSATDLATIAPTGSLRHRGWSIVAALLCALVAGGIAAARTPGGRLARAWARPRLRRRPRLLDALPFGRALPQTATGRRLAAGVVIGVLPLALSAAVAGASGHRGVVATAGSADLGTHATAEQAASVLGSRTGVAMLTQASTAAMPLWNQLLSVESSIADQQDRIAAQEREIARLAALAAPPAAADAAAPAAPTAAPDAATQTQLAALVSLHDQTKAQLQKTLQAEYDIYRSAALDPARSQQLLAGAGAVAIPEARKAVADDLGALQTQLSQEQVINDARGKLGAIGSLQQRQLDAIQKHQPFIAPEIAPLAQGFGPSSYALEPPLSFGGTFFAHFHTGLDLAGSLDSPIHAAADGVVIVAQASTNGAGQLVGYGNYVVIAHPDGFLTLYGHLNSLAVHQGQVVHQGEIIGMEGSTGNSTGPHLHFEIRHDGAFIDPLPFVAAQLGI